MRCYNDSAAGVDIAATGYGSVRDFQCHCRGSGSRGMLHGVRLSGYELIKRHQFVCPMKSNQIRCIFLVHDNVLAIQARAAAVMTGARWKSVWRAMKHADFNGCVAAVPTCGAVTVAASNVSVVGIIIHS